METTKDADSGVAVLACPNMALDLAGRNKGATANMWAVYGGVHLSRGMSWLWLVIGRQVPIFCCVPIWLFNSIYVMMGFSYH